ncbi:MAG: esterase [Leptospiraceae bacterium]|nr:esterase [Leptospiraceae bacterium]MDW8306672.1 esterase [Leptospiraceae bacterium]
MDFLEKELGGLRALVLKGDEDKAISLFHGYGASMEDLAPLAQYIRQVSNATLYFPNAPLSIDIGYGYVGYAWFPIDFAEIEALQREGKARDLSRAFPHGFAQARLYVDNFYRAVGALHKKQMVGGFSQGAMLATDLMLRSEHELGGLLILSGTLVAESEWRLLAAKKPPFSFFQSHGRHDPILPFSMAQRLFELLEEANHQGRFVEFAGGHEIPPMVLEEMLLYIQQIFP